MSWWTILVLSAGCYAFKALGLVAFGGRVLPSRVDACLDLLPAALISAIVVVSTFDGGRRLVIDARVIGLGVALIATWRKLPFPVIIILSAASVAFTRRYLA